MFYAHFVLAKKGPLARIWLAAHWDKKLTKAHVFETNIESSVEGILQPKVKMALRTSGHLLLGIVRIYSRKAKYLLADCNEAFIKIKMAFRPGVVDLPEENRAAAVATITLPEVFHDFDAAMPEITIDIDAQVTLNQSRAEDITLKEDYGVLSLITDDGFEDMGFEENEAGKDADDGFDHPSVLFQSKEVSEETANVNKSLDAPLKDDGFGGAVGEGLLDGETGGLFEPTGLFDDAPLDASVSLENNSSLQNYKSKNLYEKQNSGQHNNDSDEDMYDMGPGSLEAPSPPSSPGLHLNEISAINLDHGNPVFVDASGSDVEPNMPPPSSALDLDDTAHEEDAFALAPLDANLSQGWEKFGKGKRKRKLIVDEVKNLSGEEMKSQLSDTKDITSSLDLAPPSKRLMHWKEIGGVEKLFSLPGHSILSRTLCKAYQRHLTTRSVDNDDFGLEEDRINLDADIEQIREEESIAPRKRRREMEIILPQDLSHLDTMHLDSSRQFYSTDNNLSNPSLDVTSFLQHQHHMFPPLSNQQLPDQSQHQMMSNVMPPVMQHPPPTHMIHQMLQNDLPHIPQMMHPMVDQRPQHHAMPTNMHNVHNPAANESYNQAIHHSAMEPIPQHFPTDSFQSMSDHMQHHTVEKQLASNSPRKNLMNHHSLQEQVSQTPANHMSCIKTDFSSFSDDHMAQHPVVSRQVAKSVDEEITHPLLDDVEPQAGRDSGALQLQATPEIPLSDIKHTGCLNEPENHNQQILSDCSFLSGKEVESQPDTLEAICCEPQENQSIINQENSSKSKEHPVSEEEDDYDAPSSVGPILIDEQMADETYEQFEERMLTKRTTQMIHSIRDSLIINQRLSFSELVKNNKRKQVAQKFYTFLVLKKQQAVELEQYSTFGDMIITKGPKFDDVDSGN